MKSRRIFLKNLAGAAGMLGFERLGLMNAYAQAGSGYKALVCIFMFGGNDGHNTIIPLDPAQHNAYKSFRNGIALSPGSNPTGTSTAFPVSAAAGSFGLNAGLSAIHPLWGLKKLAAVGNVGMLVQPTTRTQYLGGAVPVPTNLFSHSDQVVQMQSGIPSSSGGTGWAGRIADSVQYTNGSASFPASISMNGPQLFCQGSSITAASLIPGFDGQFSGMNLWPQSASDAKRAAFQELLTFDSGMTLVQRANKVMSDAVAMNNVLTSTPSGAALTTVFPGTSLGNQLKEVAKVINLRNTTGLMRQVFFCSIDGFDTHGSQGWTHWDLLRQLSEAMLAFYNATVEMGVASQVTTFTASEFGRTLQWNGAGTDHGWGNNHLVLGGAVKGGELYGQLADMSIGSGNDAGSRGSMIPTTSTDQFGATLAKWFGVAPASMLSIFPNLAQFGVSDLGFLA